MARYPTYEEYEARGNFKDGIKRCDDMLKKSPNDVTLLAVKLKLLYAAQGDAQAVLDQLVAIQPPISDFREIVMTEDAVVHSQTNTFPKPKTVGPSVAKLWDNATKASNSGNAKFDLQSLRFSRAIVDNRPLDAQQALIQLKAIAPKNRVIYMAHLALTQMLSTSKDDLQSKLSLSLARKAVTEKFDEDKALDCRVSGQIFAIQNSTKDLEGIADRPFKESKQVYDTLRKEKKVEIETNGAAESNELKDPSSVPPAEWLFAEVEVLKTKFRELVEVSAELEAVLKFAKNAVRLFHTARRTLTEDRRRVKPDACFLSISALIRAFEHTSDTAYLLQSAFLAETLLQQNEHIHEARMILMYLYMRLGLGSLALRMWESLRIREIQHDTVGHVLFTRLSTTHPSSTKLKGKDQIDPSERLRHAVEVYNRHEEKLSEYAASVLDHGQTGMIFDLQELRDKLRSSFTQRVIHLERLRTARLSSSGTASNSKSKEQRIQPPRLTADWLTFTDNRDFATTFNYGYNVEKALQTTNGAIPGRKYLLHTLAIEQAHLLAIGPTSAQKPIADIENLVAEFESIDTCMERLNLNDDSELGVGMRESEYLVGDLACQVIRMLQDAAPSAAKWQEDIGNIAKGVERLNVDALVASKDVLAETTVEHYLYLNALQLVVKACGRVKEQEGGSDLYVKDLIEKCKGYQKSVVAHARERSRSIKAEDVREVLARDTEIWENMQSFGEKGIISFCDSVVASAQEGWDGVTKVDLKVK